MKILLAILWGLHIYYGYALSSVASNIGPWFQFSRLEYRSVCQGQSARHLSCYKYSFISLPFYQWIDWINWIEKEQILSNQKIMSD